MYAIKVTFYYYEGTFHVPKDGYFTDREGYRLEFETFEQAFKYLTENSGEMKLVKGKTTYESAINYYLLDHGEYARPQYTIRKLRGSNK